MTFKEYNQLSPYWIQSGKFYFIPICHYRLEFCESVRLAFQHIQPDAIALELPESMTESVKEAVLRLPEISVILYQSHQSRPSLYLLIEPVDGLVEAARRAVENSLPLICIDLDLDEYGQIYDTMPDTYSLMQIGHKTYYESFVRTILQSKKPFVDLQREQGMAMNLLRFAKQTEAEKIMVICGMSHLQGIIDNLTLPQVTPLTRKKIEHIQVFNLHPESVREVLYSYSFLSAVYEYARHSLPLDVDLNTYTVRKQGHFQSLDDIDEYFKPTSSEEEALDAAIRWASRRCSTQSGDSHNQYADNSDRSAPRSDIVDRQKVAMKLYDLASLHYNQDTGESTDVWQKRTFVKFSRNYAIQQGNLIPDFFHLLVSARSCIDDNFGYAFWRLGTYYPWQKEVSDRPTIRITGDDLFLGMRKIKIQRFLPRRRQRWNLVPLRKRPHEEIPGEWLTSFDGDMICSYPPEDIEIESWGGFLKARASRLLSIEKKRTEPFTTSLLDGIDVRETIRNLYEKKIYVQEFGKIGGDVGAVVVIFDHDLKDKKYPFLMTWLGESHQEGDMALYSTHPLNHIVGPGISRCEYGGFMLSYPPFRLFDVWTDPVYDFVQSKSECLLAAALDYSLEKYVVYVANEPPRPFFKSLAGKLGRNIVFIPVSTFSPPKLKKLRVFHILSSHDKREMAPDYIW